MDDGARLSTEMVDATVRSEAWRDFTRPFFDAVPALDQEARPMHGEVGIRPLGSVLLGPTGYSAQRHTRSRRTIVAGDYEHCVIQLSVQGGSEGVFGDEPVRIGTGDVTLFDYARPFAIDVEAGRTLSMVLPRAPLETALAGRPAHGAVIRGATPMGRLIGQVMTSVDAVADQLNPDEAEGAVDAILSLAARGVSGETAVWAETAGGSRALREAIIRHIQDNLKDRDLGPAALMARFNVSRAHLYRMFENDGGVMTLIRERRLDAFYRALTRPEKQAATVAALARDWGFSSVDQLQRNFRARFGVTPTEARDEGYSLSVGDRSVSKLHARIKDFAGRFRTEGR
ncbi:helix-turn-helix domain-containing protein [Glycocaulis profundi]|nr:helix-turn-helix domain-containing protein [Glycocaulis profundi]